MNKVYKRINWENYPSDATPLNEANLNNLDSATDTIDDRVITLDTTKATKTEVATLVSDVTFEESTGIITITKKNGSRVTIDTQMEKIAVNFDYDQTTQQIILTLIDGTKQYIDLSALITQYEFLDTDTVAFIIGTDGKVSAIVKEGSIKEEHLEPNYLAKVKVEVAKAQTSASNAATSEDNARSAATEAQDSATAAATSKSNAQTSAAAAAQSEYNAKASENVAKSSRDAAVESAQTATEKATSASESAITASEKADIATRKATEIIGKAESAADSATKAQSYAVGGTGSREGEDFDNAKYYYQQAKDVSEGLKGGLQPHGTVAFADLPALADVNAGWMYNISDEFTTTDDFKEGAGNVIPAGANIYKTSDEKWDVLAGTPVTGIKGVNEDSFRRGNVELTAENVGAVATGGDTAENTVKFNTASERKNLASGESHTTLFGKIAKWFADLKTVAFSGSYNDLSNKPTIPTVVNNNTTTEAGYALDARQANPNVEGSLGAQISALNSGLMLRPIYPLYTGKTAVSGARDDPYKVVEDGYIQFWYQVNDNKNNNNCGIICYIDGTIVHEYFEYHQAGAANENYSALFPVLKGQTAQFHIVTDSVTQSAMIYHYPARV